MFSVRNLCQVCSRPSFSRLLPRVCTYRELLSCPTNRYLRIRPQDRTNSLFTSFSPVSREPCISFYSTEQQSDAVKKVGQLVHANRVVLFMKGTPDEPRCGFSMAVCRILEMHGILDKAKQGDDPKLFASYNVLDSDEFRNAVKQYADWPTFPQVYFDGEFVGGCDILVDMHKSGKLREELERIGIGSALTKTEGDKKS